MSLSFNQFRMISYLDLMCCGFGGALLLFLIASSAGPPPSTNNQLVVIRCRHVAGPRAEVGLEYQSPGNPEWVRPALGPRLQGIVTFAARSRPASGSEAVLILTTPAVGRWKIRPYLIDFAAPASVEGGHTTPSRGLTVTIDAMGRGVSFADGIRESKLLDPGDTGNTVVVAVDSSSKFK